MTAALVYLQLPSLLKGEEKSLTEPRVPATTVPGYWRDYFSAHEWNMHEQWTKFIYPFIRNSNFSSVVEIGAGACRNTEKLFPLSDRIVVTDIDPSALDMCRHRFRNRLGSSKLRFLLVDGSQLPLPSASVSLVYQFDAGVHFHREVVQSYVKEFGRLLIPGGTGFFHHSNLGASRRSVVSDTDFRQNWGWRSNLSREAFRAMAREAGLETFCHPVVDWEDGTNLFVGPRLDAFACFRKPLVHPVGDERWSNLLDCPRRLRVRFGWN